MRYQTAPCPVYRPIANERVRNANRCVTACNKNRWNAKEIQAILGGYANRLQLEFWCNGR